MKNSENRYSTFLKAWEMDQASNGEEIIILTPKEATLSGNSSLQEDAISDRGTIIYSGKGNNSVSWKFSVKKAGLYNIELDYMTIDGNGSKIQRSLYIDGQLPLIYPPTICFSSDDNERVSMVMKDIEDYVIDMQSKFITGLSKFDNFVYTINKMGIQDIIDIYQKYYDTYKYKK